MKKSMICKWASILIWADLRGKVFLNRWWWFSSTLQFGRFTSMDFGGQFGPMWIKCDEWCTCDERMQGSSVCVYDYDYGFMVSCGWCSGSQKVTVCSDAIVRGYRDSSHERRSLSEGNTHMKTCHKYWFTTTEPIFFTSSNGLWRRRRRVSVQIHFT